MAQVEFEAWFTCLNAVGKEAKAMIAIEGGEIVVSGPAPGSIRFGSHQLEEAREFNATFQELLEVLERREQQRALRVGREMLARREAPAKKHPKRRRRS